MASACKFGDGFQSPGGWALGQLLSLYVETQEHILMAATTSNSFSIAKVPPRFGTASRKSCIFLCSVFQRKTLMLSPKFLCSSLYSRSKERHHCPGHWPTQQWGSRYSLENNSSSGTPSLRCRSMSVSALCQAKCWAPGNHREWKKMMCALKIPF